MKHISVIVAGNKIVSTLMGPMCA